MDFELRVQTDERQYEVLLTDVDSQAYRITYYAPLETKGDSWQIVDVYFSDDLEARIFGRRVDAPPFQPPESDNYRHHSRRWSGRRILVRTRLDQRLLRHTFMRNAGAGEFAEC